MSEPAKWNYEMSDAPKGRVIYSKRKAKDGSDIQVPTFVYDYVILCADDEKQTVTRSRWIPKEQRWEFFATGQRPLAWQHYPTHPKAGEAQ